MSTATFDSAPQDLAPPAGMRQAIPPKLAPPAGVESAIAAQTAHGEGLTRVYRARTVEELIPKIQAELGADAIVVRRHKGLTGGIAGFFQRPFVEIEAKAGTPRIDRYDDDVAAPALPSTPTQPAALEPPPAPSSARGTYASYAGTSDALAVRAEDLAAEEFHELTPTSLLARVATRNGARRPTPVQAGDPFAAALAEAEAAVLPAETACSPAQAAAPPAQATMPPAQATMPPAQATMPPARAATPPAQAAAPPTRAAAITPRGRARTQIEASLLGYGVAEPLVRELIETAAAHVLPLMPARASLARAVHRTLAQRIPSAAPLPVGSATIALVGPGGSGKTACCAALLEAYRERSTLPAVCATVLAGATRSELEVLLSPHLLEPTPLAAPQVAQALRDAREEGLLLLDLPALSPADRGSIRAVAALLGSVKPDRVILALPATLGAKQAAQLLEALAPLGASALAITHVDETDQLGVAVEAACAFGLAPEYLLDRGRGRGGLIQIDPTYLADRLLPAPPARSGAASSD
jgi:flagellar biosynthesis GTPase FlhF